MVIRGTIEEDIVFPTSSLIRILQKYWDTRLFRPKFRLAKLKNTISLYFSKANGITILQESGHKSRGHHRISSTLEFALFFSRNPSMILRLDEKDYWNSGNQHTAKLFQVWDHRTLRNHSTQWNHIPYAGHHNLLPLIPWLPVKLLIRFKLRGGYIYFRGYVYSGAQCNRLSLLWVPSFTD